MKKFDILGWDKKQRTMIRHIKPGDIFMFRRTDGSYGAGRIISRLDIGHVAEIFDMILKNPHADVSAFDKAKRIAPPIIIDSYRLFDKKIEGDWRIVAHQSDYTAPEIPGVYFSYGAPGAYKKVDCFGNETSISENEARALPSYSADGDIDVQRLLSGILSSK